MDGTRRKRGRARALSEQDRAAWAAYARHVRVFEGRDIPPEPPAAAPEPSRPPSQPDHVQPPPPPRVAPLMVGVQPGGVDNATFAKLRTGKLAPSRTLDLHGRTAQRAYHAFSHFLHAAHADHLRVVEVITGRGSGEAGGVLRRELPLWLNLPGLRPLVLAAVHPTPGNVGAVRLLLRRPR